MSDKYRVLRGEAAAIDIERFRRTLESEGYRVFEWSDPAKQVYPLHQHATDQSHWIVSGRLELEVRGAGTFTLEAGDRDYMPAGTQHSARVLGDEPVVYLIGEKR